MLCLTFSETYNCAKLLLQKGEDLDPSHKALGKKTFYIKVHVLFFSILSRQKVTIADIQSLFGF